MFIQRERSHKTSVQYHLVLDDFGRSVISSCLAVPRRQIWPGDLCLPVHATSSIEPEVDITQFNLSAGVINQSIAGGCL